MTGALPEARLAHQPRGRIRADLVYLGWQQAAAQPEPGPMPHPPAETELDDVSADWLAAQRREQRRLARPARLGTAAAVAATAVAAGCWVTGVLAPEAAMPVVLAAAGLSARCVRAEISGRRRLRAQISSEQQRVQRIRAVQQATLAAGREQYQRTYREWQKRGAACWRQPQWYPVTLPVEVARLDLAGGTPAGWSALLTMIAASRLAAGGEVTVLDLTEGGVACDLLALAPSLGIDPLVWVLPADLPRLDLGLHFSQEALAEVLALTVAAAEPGSAGASGTTTGLTADPARDAALLGRVLGVLGPAASMAQLTAGLQALAQIGDPRGQLSAGLVSPEQMTGLTGMFGRSADHLVVDRAWALEARLRVLSSLGVGPASRRASRLRVAWPDRRGSATGNGVLGSYLTVALTEALRQDLAGRPWQQTLCVLGAESLPGDVLDRLSDAAEGARTGLVLGYRSIPAPVRERLGRGNAAVAFMRLGNAEDARAAAEQIGSEHRFVVSQLTDTIGTSVTDTAGDSYSSTVGVADSVADSGSATWTAGRNRGRGRSTHGLSPPFAESGSASRDVSSSAAVSDSRSISEGISASTSWGLSLSRAIGTSGSLAGTLQRSRELVIEQHELQHLPQTAVVICQGGPAGREVVLADANPAIMTLPAATLASQPATTGQPADGAHPSAAAQQRRPLGSNHDATIPAG